LTVPLYDIDILIFYQIELSFSNIRRIFNAKSKYDGQLRN
jgi:hypothetical protein